MSDAAIGSGSLASSRVRTPRQEAWRRFKKNRFALFFLFVFGVFFALAVTAQILESTLGDDHFALALVKLDPVRFKGYSESVSPPSFEGGFLGLLGTDYLGRSVLMRVFHGTKVAFVVGLFASMLSVFIGMTLGLMAGFLGRVVDEIVVYVYSTLASIPYLLLMLALGFLIRNGDFKEAYESFNIFGRYPSKAVSLGLLNLVIVIGATSWITLCRLVRAEVLKVRELDYVTAARSLGFGRFRIMFKHVLPNVMHLVIINFSLTFVIAIKSEVILTFLNVGVDKEPSWGQMISIAKNELMKGVWWPLAAAGTMLFVLTLAVNYVGDALRDALDPKLKT